jgi:hypothetical protein
MFDEIELWMSMQFSAHGNEIGLHRFSNFNS